MLTAASRGVFRLSLLDLLTHFTWPSKAFVGVRYVTLFYGIKKERGINLHIIISKKKKVNYLSEIIVDQNCTAAFLFFFFA